MSQHPARRSLTPETISLIFVDGQSVAERIEAARQLLTRLSDRPEIDSSSVFEQSRIVVKVPKGLEGREEWAVDFHVAWPNPQLNNQHFNSFKLLNWTSAALKGTGSQASPTSAASAQKLAIANLKTAIDQLIAPGQELHDRIDRPDS